MKTNLLFAFIFLVVSAHSAFAAGGACPTGANYLNTTNPAGALVPLSSLGITNCFYVAANGSDSNSGTSESAPWQHAPGMSTCTANCGANTPSGGTGYIFRGGDTWHMGASADSPYTNGWNWTWSGTSQSVPIYIGIDPTWYSGSSWARPTLTGDNATNACPGSGPCAVSSCAHDTIGGSSANTLVSFAGLKWNIFDNFEMTGLCWNASINGGNNYVTFNSGTENSIVPYFIVVENTYCHGWTHTTAGNGDENGCWSGNASYGGAVIQFNVCDGQDSDDLAGSCLGPNSDDAYILRYNVMRRFGTDQVSNDCHYVHDNLFEYMNLGNGHGDNLFCFTEVAGGSSSPNLFFNNVFRYIGDTYNENISYVLDMGTPSGQTDYAFNNIFHDNQNATAGGGDYISDESRVGNWVLFNNTGEMTTPNGNTLIDVSSGGGSAITSVNNHWIATPATQASVFSSAPGSETEAVYMTNSTATTQGYTSSTDFAPTASSSSTVTASGVNETNAYCTDSVLHYAIAETECVNGTSGAISYNTSTHTVSYPGIGLNSRPSTGAWQVGAYEFGGSGITSVQPPTSVTVAVQ